MVTSQSVQEQLKRLQFSVSRWGRAELKELPHILIPDEQIYECVNGYYEGGFALLIATNFRVLLIDKKPLNYLTVEDLRFDMINEIDYSHRLFGAQITVSTGSKTLRFRSYNQPRLRKLIGHVQHCMAEAKQHQSQHAEGQSQHLERINQQLQTYLLAQLQHQQELTQQLREAQQQGVQLKSQVAEVKPNPELADFLFAQSLLRQYQDATGLPQADPVVSTPVTLATPASPQADELYAEGMQEIFGKHQQQVQTVTVSTSSNAQVQAGLEVNPLRIAYSKLPMALRNRKFGMAPVRAPLPNPQVAQP